MYMHENNRHYDSGKKSPECTFFQLAKAGRAVGSAYDRGLRISGLNAKQLAILLHIDMSGHLSVSDIATCMAMDQTTATRNLQVLAKAGYVSFEPDFEDNRKRNAVLTEEGRKKKAEGYRQWEKIQNAMLTFLGCDNLEKLHELLHRIQQFE